jgi:hypothetical protein
MTHDPVAIARALYAAYVRKDRPIAGKVSKSSANVAKKDAVKRGA